jgi:hypothetical protein
LGLLQYLAGSLILDLVIVDVLLKVLDLLAELVRLFPGRGEVVLQLLSLGSGGVTIKSEILLRFVEIGDVRLCSLELLKEGVVVGIQGGEALYTLLERC